MEHAERTDRAHAPENGTMDIGGFVRTVIADIKGYIRAEKRYLKLRASEKIATMIGKLVAMVVLLTAGTLVLLFLSIALALWVGELLASYPIGFVVVGAFYALLALLFHLWWKGAGQDRFVLDRIADLLENKDQNP